MTVGCVSITAPWLRVQLVRNVLAFDLKGALMEEGLGKREGGGGEQLPGDLIKHFSK